MFSVHVTEQSVQWRDDGVSIHTPCNRSRIASEKKRNARADRRDEVLDRQESENVERLKRECPDEALAQLTLIFGAVYFGMSFIVKKKRFNGNICPSGN